MSKNIRVVENQILGFMGFVQHACETQTIMTSDYEYDPNPSHKSHITLF